MLSFEINTLTLAGIPPVLLKVLETTREAVLVVDGSMRILASNESAYKAFGRGDGPLEGRRLSEVIRDPGLHRAFMGAIANGVAADLRVEYQVVDQRSFDVHVSSIDIGNGSRKAIGFFYEVTQLERLEQVRQEFLSNISHELRTPLTSILAFVETLEDGAIDDKENNRRFVSIIRRNAERMHALIADILELSQIESGNVSVEIARVSLARLVAEVFASLASQAELRSVKLINEVPDDVRVAADPGRLEQMLTNLIDNAIKFNREGRTVTVGSRSLAGRDIISVADEGVGIPTEQLNRIFERFYRADRARTSGVGGTGLGLAIVKHLAKLHGGEISASSRLGEGTIFTIELPSA